MVKAEPSQPSYSKCDPTGFCSLLSITYRSWQTTAPGEPYAAFEHEKLQTLLEEIAVFKTKDFTYMIDPVSAHSHQKREAVLFDYDNTLRITEPPTIKAATELLLSWLAKRGVKHDLSFESLQSDFMGITFDSMVDRVAKQFGIDVAPAERASLIQQELDGSIEILKGRSLPSPGADIALQRLSQMGVILAVVSSSAPQRLEACMQAAGQLDYINMQRVYSCQDPHHPTPPKPSPAIYTRAISSLGVSVNQCIAVEDSIPGISAAVSAGVLTIGFNGALDPLQRSSASQAFFKAGARWAIHDLAFVPAILNLMNTGRSYEVDTIFGSEAK